ncbi:MAG TPA: proton-conducting transporter membrane subunit [Anaerolineae bacterium]|nr:proton-conducting transporter membrane subunit [Anaerolineae bacterium]
MNLLLLIFLPLGAAAPVYLLRRYWTAAISVSVAAILALIGICARTPLGQTGYLLGRELILDDLNRFLLLLFYVLAGLMILYTWRSPQGWAFCPCLLAILGLLSGAMLIRTFLIAVFLLEMAALIFVFTIHGRRPAPTGTALGYLVPQVLAAPCLLLLPWLFESFTLHPENALLIRFAVIALSLGFGIMLAAAPFHSWLPAAVRGAPPMAGALLICIFSQASLALMIGVMGDNPWLATDAPTLSVISTSGVLTALIGGLFAFGQRQPGRLLAYAAISDMGFVLVGLGTGTLPGITAALAHSVNRSLTVLLVAMSMGALGSHLKRETPSTLREALRQTPGGTLGYIAGGLALGGFPLFNGFATRWLVYRSLTEFDALFLGALVLSGVGVVLGYLRSWSVMLQGSSETGEEREPLMVTVIILSLASLCLLLGLVPGLLVTPLHDILQGIALVGPGV